MTYALMLWTIVACDAYSCRHDWRQVASFEKTTESKALCEEAAKALFDGRKYKCVRTK
jgi:phytoene/squalene synthetase